MNYKQTSQLKGAGKVLWNLTAMLQDLTNAVLFRRFTVQAGVISNGMPAVVLSVKRLIGSNETIAMDMRTYLDMVRHLAKDEETDYTVTGFDVQAYVNKVAGNKVTMDKFTVPSWAFPRAEYDLMMCARQIIDTAERFSGTIDKVAKIMLESGVPESEVQKFTNSVKGSGGSGEKPTIH